MRRDKLTMARTDATCGASVRVSVLFQETPSGTQTTVWAPAYRAWRVRLASAPSHPQTGTRRASCISAPRAAARVLMQMCASRRARSWPDNRLGQCACRQLIKWQIDHNRVPVVSRRSNLSLHKQWRTVAPTYDTRELLVWRASGPPACQNWARASSAHSANIIPFCFLLMKQISSRKRTRAGLSVRAGPLGAPLDARTGDLDECVCEIQYC